MQNYLEALFFKAFSCFGCKTFHFLSVIMRWSVFSRVLFFHWKFDQSKQHTFIAAEVKDASRIVPKAMILGIIAVCAAYLFINFAYLKLIPINQKYSLRELLDYITKIPLAKKQYIIYEYLLIDGLNDTVEDAQFEEVK